MTKTPNIIVKTVDYKGRRFSAFYPARSSQDGPGWYVFGRNEGYDNRLIMLCARPDVPARRHPHYNIRVQHGWSTKREAQAVCNALLMSTILNQST